MSVDVEDRRRYTAMLLGREAAPPPDGASGRVIRGVILDITSHLACVATQEGEERFIFDRTTSFWRGREVASTDLRVGDDVFVLCGLSGRWVAERVWAQLARVTGVIAARAGDTLEIDVGHGRPNRTVVIPYRASGRMSVRHPALEPGFLFDAIGTWRDGAVEAVIPATNQPPYPVSESPRRPPVQSLPDQVTGMVSWYDPAQGRATHVNPLVGLAGAAYPALDRGSDCGFDCDRGESCVALPRLSLGATFSLRNDCNGVSAVLPVVDCASSASRFCDKCAACPTEESGRIAQLTLLRFISLGGHPEAGCFNATMTVGVGP